MGKQQTARTSDPKTARLAPCPKESPGLPLLPLQRPAHMLADFWLARSNNPPTVLLDALQIAEHNKQVATLAHEGWPAGRWNLLQRPADPQNISAHLQLQITRLREAIQKGKRVLADGRPPWALAAKLERSMRASAPSNEIRIAHVDTPIRCYPTSSAIYDEPWQLPFDLMQCSQLRYGEPVRVLRKGTNFWYVWSSYTEGWVKPAALTPALTPEQAKAAMKPEQFVLIIKDRAPIRMKEGGLRMARLGARLAKAGRKGPTGWARRRDGLGPASRAAHSDQRVRERPDPQKFLSNVPPRHVRVLAPTPSGMKIAFVSDEDVWPKALNLRRGAFLRAAFSLLDTPYGWGGTGGNRDCSRLLMDLFSLFDLQLPRNSWQQSNAGTQRVDVGELNEADKRAMIEKAAEDNLVLLYLPGHIALYLGRDGDHLFALHQFSGYQSVCEGGGLTMNRVNRTTVTALELGRGTKRRAFIQRITRLVLFGPGMPKGDAQ